jgi:ABC-type phosphate/phosphonate transport system substrate-binding protein
VLLCVLLAACRRQGAQGPTLQPTLTTTPRSTPLPSLEPTVAPGSENNPIRMTIVQPGGATRETALERATDNVATALLEESGLTVEVELVESDADGIAALCDVSGVPAVAWLSGIGYGVASANACGTPALMVERGTGRQITTGETVQIIVNGESEATDISGLAGHTFCRLGFEDFYTWLVPTLMLRTGGIAEMPDAVDQPDSAALIQAVADSDCDAAGLTATDFDEFAGDAESDVRVLNRTVTIPYAILMVPSSLPLDARTALLDALEAMAESDDLATLLNQDGLVRVGDGDLADLDTFLSSTGVDFAQLGE